MRRHKCLAQVIFSLILLLDFQCTCSSSVQEDTFRCFRMVLNHYNDIYGCPWDITISCSSPDFICYKNDSLCDLVVSHPTNISLTVFWSTIPILRHEKTVGSGASCKCKEVKFSCYITLNNNTSLQDPCGDGISSTLTLKQENGNCGGEIVGAMFGGAALSILIIAISYLVTKKYRNVKQKQTARGSIEIATENPAYGSTPVSDTIDQQQKTRSMNSSHVYNTISDNTYQLKVSHVTPIVRYETVTSGKSKDGDSATLNHLSASDYTGCENREGHSKAVSGVTQPPMDDYDIVNSPGANEYTEVVGDGFLNSSNYQAN